MSKRPIYQHGHRTKPLPRWPLYGLAAVLVFAVFISWWQRQQRPVLNVPKVNQPAFHAVGGAGALLGVDTTRHFTVTEAQTVARENYGASTPVITTGVTKVTFHYRSYEVDGAPITIYGRAYLPDDAPGQLPVFAFAPGTTGIGDQCAASLEQPHKANWGNYDSHLVTYASQGYAVVTTDYEGMRDPSRLHHYMVGPLEGRALLDSIRALGQLSQTEDRLDPSHVFVAGYSQGGHAAFWADTIDATYAPDIKLSGVIGFGPVLSVEATMNDVVRGSILDWFGPYVLTSYSDYYHQNYGDEQIVQPRYLTNLVPDVLSHCVDSAYAFWGHDAAAVYTSQYLDAVKGGTFAAAFPALAHDLAQNATGTEATSTPKLINEGHYDVVVMPSQAQSALPAMCQASSGHVNLKIYPSATHFNTMVVSLKDTLTWLSNVRSGAKLSSSCPPSA